MAEAIYEAHITYSADIGELDMTTPEKERFEKDRWNVAVRKHGIKIRLITIKEIKNREEELAKAKAEIYESAKALNKENES